MRGCGVLLVIALLTQTAAAGGEGEDKFTLEPIVVTAQKVESDLQDVPVSLSVIRSQEINDTLAVELEELSDQVPNFTLRRQQSTEILQRITIRGVGAYSRNIGFDTRAGVYLDGVYMGQSPALNAELLDLERVEVLRGPQGTLYGKNTVAGAVNLISKKPRPDFECEATLEAGNLDYKNGRIKANLPLVEGRLYGKIAGLHLDRDGFYENVVNGNDLNDEKTNAFRLSLAGIPADTTKVTVSMDGSFSERECTYGDPLTDTFAVSRDTAAPDDFEVSYNFTPIEKRDVWGLSATLEHELNSDFNITAISGYRDTGIEFRNDLDFSAVDLMRIVFKDDYEQFSQEIRFQSPSGRQMEYTAGLHYSWQEGWTFRTAILGEEISLLGDPRMIAGEDVPNSGDVIIRSYAAFFNGEYHLTEKFGLQAGFRHTYETKTADFFLDGSQSGFFNIAVWDFKDTRTDAVFTPSAGITFDFTDDLTGYAIVTTGFKSGGFNLDWLTPEDVSAGVEYNKETVTNYETGLKVFLPEYRLRANLAVFYAQFTDYQVHQFIDLGGGATAISIRNAAEVTSRGMELEVNVKPTARWSFTTGISLLDAAFEKFPGGGRAGSDASGNELPFAPNFTAGVGAEYNTPLSSLPAALTLRGHYFYTDDYFTQESNVRYQPLAGGGRVPFGYMDSYGLLSGKISLDSNSGAWSAFVWGKNLLDEEYVTDSNRDFLGTIVAIRGMPRTFGAGVTLRY